MGYKPLDKPILHKRTLHILVFIASAVLLPHTARAGLQYDWQAPFSSAEQLILRQWIDETFAALESLVGPMPFTVHVRLYRRDASREPVPWANTRRGRKEGVNFHVDPSFALASFQQDWTASHELSHLILPYLGEKNAWFAEGFASYMQYQVMMAAQQLTANEVNSRYLERLSRAKDRYPFVDQPFAEAASELRKARAYPVMYWGGAAYFLQVDAALKQKTNTSLIEVLQRYLVCCRNDQQDLNILAATLDELSDSQIFSTTLTQFRTQPGFPSYQMLEAP